MASVRALHGPNPEAATVAPTSISPQAAARGILLNALLLGSSSPSGGLEPGSDDFFPGVGLARRFR